MIDYVMVAVVAASSFFAALSLSLLAKFRQVSARISSSTELGRDLWEALEARLKKQDERILDMFGKVDVIQARMVERQMKPESVVLDRAQPALLRREAPNVSRMNGRKPEPTQSDGGSSLVLPQPVIQPESMQSIEARLAEQERRTAEMYSRLATVISQREIERTGLSVVTPGPLFSGPSPPREPTTKVNERTLLEMLGERPRTSVEIKEQFSITREHAARVLKDLFDRRLVIRNDSHKPFVYELTELGRTSLRS
jgi:hypothetical protein